MKLQYQPERIIRFASGQETLLELKMTDGALILWGIARRDRFSARLEGDQVEILGELANSRGPVVRFTGDGIVMLSSVQIEVMAYAPEPARDRSHDAGQLRRS